MLSKIIDGIKNGVASAMLWASQLVGKKLPTANTLEEAQEEPTAQLKVYQINRKRRRVLAACMRRQNKRMGNINQSHIPRLLNKQDLSGICKVAGISPEYLLSHA